MTAKSNLVVNWTNQEGQKDYLQTAADAYLGKGFCRLCCRVVCVHPWVPNGLGETGGLKTILHAGVCACLPPPLACVISTVSLQVKIIVLFHAPSWSSGGQSHEICSQMYLPFFHQTKAPLGPDSKPSQAFRFQCSIKHSIIIFTHKYTGKRSPSFWPIKPKDS